MNSTHSFIVEKKKRFSESLIWELNRSYYHQAGIDAWRNGIVPHHMTSNSFVGKTYAEIILGFLKDLASGGNINDTVYILELGAGHGRLAFHILKHLSRLIALTPIDLPPFCYVVSDIVEKNLAFFYSHPQLQPYLENGTLDIAYFDAMHGDKIHLRNQDINISHRSLNQPLLAIGNYFFDSIPADLFKMEENKIELTSLSLECAKDHREMNPDDLLKKLELEFSHDDIKFPFYDDSIMDEVLKDYENGFSKTHIFFPSNSIKCLNHLRNLSKSGLMVLTMDKGFTSLASLDKMPEPEIITHGSFSLWVNFHALGKYCEISGGEVLFPQGSDFHLQVGCLIFREQERSHPETRASYQRYIDDFGPDDFNSLKKSTYKHLKELDLISLIALIRLSHYDSTFFMTILPRIKQNILSLSMDERTRYKETMLKVWEMYYSIDESYDLAYELGGMYYDLGYYSDALELFHHSRNTKGDKADLHYNEALCYYQLRKDKLFQSSLLNGKNLFPDSSIFLNLEALDLNAK